MLAIEHGAGPDVTTNPGVISQIRRFIEQNEAKSVVMIDGVIGWSHEEGKESAIQ